MKKVILITAGTLFLASGVFADIGTNAQKQNQKSQSERESIQYGEQLNDNYSKQKSVGSENSTTNSNTKSKTKSTSKTNTKTATETKSWTITVSPFGYFSQALLNAGWDKRAFFVSPRDLGTVGYMKKGYIDELAKDFTEKQAAYKNEVDEENLPKIEEVINVLYATGSIMDKAKDKMAALNAVNLEGLSQVAGTAAVEAARQYKHNYVHISSCNFNKDVSSYFCHGAQKGGNNTYILQIATDVPSLTVNGDYWYSQSKVAYKSLQITASFADSTSDALAKLAQTSETASIATAVRDFTSKLESKGQTKTAQMIRNKFVEKALTNTDSLNSQATIQAINSGSPTAVLKIFQ